MSRLAAMKARELHERYHDITIPVDMDKVATAEGCELMEWPFLGHVKEVKQGRWIGLAQGLDTRERRHLIAHALGHHLMHCGNQLSFHGQQQVQRSRQEREADDFAAHVLVPERELEKMGQPTAWEVAEHFDVPEQMAALRLDQFATEEERERWNLLDEI